MPFCSNCGQRLSDDAKFCPNCGVAIKRIEESVTTTRKQVFEGEIRKCPNCGEVLKSFEAVCPVCGYEIRDAQSPSSVREFALKLEAISAQRMPVFEEKKSFMKMVFGKDFKENDEAQEALRRFEFQKAKEKASLIINFSVPNTKEDITEFMILAVSNIDIKQGLDDGDIVTNAWVSKLGQVYKKAKLSFGHDKDFQRIEEIFKEKEKEIKIAKKRAKRSEFLPFLILFGCLGILGIMALLGIA